MKKENDAINYKKLFFELMILLSIIFLVVCAVLYPVLKSAGAFKGETDKYAAYRGILNDVDNYDYSKGRNLEFEKELDDVYYNSENGKEIYAYAMARGTYYCNNGMYETANAAFTYLEKMSSSNVDDFIEAQTRKVMCDRKKSNDV